MKVNFENIYDHIGHLFFSIAYHHKPLSVIDEIKLNDLVDEMWSSDSVSDPLLNRQLVGCIHGGIKEAIENRMSTTVAWNSFLNFYQLHSFPFSLPLKEKILSASVRIAKEFAAADKNFHPELDLANLFGVRPAKV